MDAARASVSPEAYLDMASRLCARPLDATEQTVLMVLDDQFVSASVVRIRARQLLYRTARAIPAESVLAERRPVASTAAICHDLERRGLVERAKVAGVERWRRA